jgi:alkylation response protein AidB-like acyl-CoA dehydrogenase
MPSLDSESKRIIESTLQRFVEESYDFAEHHKRLAKLPLDYRRYWPTLAELGVLGMPVDEALGGLSGYATDIFDTVSTLASGLILEPFVDAAVIAGSLLAAGGQQDEIDRLIAGETITILLGGRPGSEDELLCERQAESLRLNGRLRVQPYAAQADAWLIAVRDGASGAQLLLQVRPEALELDLSSYRLLDNRPASDLQFDDVGVPASAILLEGERAVAALHRAQGLAACCLGAETVGVMAHLLELTGDYLRTRKQFGVPLSSFQALQHRYADMQMAYLESQAIVRKLAGSLERAEVAEAAWLAHAVLLVVERAAARLGHEAIQMHGGMGATDELVVSHCNNRLVVLVRQLHGWVQPDAQVVDTLAEPAGKSESSFDEASFRIDVRQFVEQQLDPQTRHKVRNGLYLEKHDYVGWQQALRTKGWFGATWPKAFGGQDWSVRQEHVFLQECALNAAPMLIPYGVNMLGPVLHAFGSEEQQRRYLPGILDSDTWWCQGYSEPNAGSDLASLNTSAVREGDQWVVNGTKMWTTEAHWADMMHCLVRTDRGGKKQQGITFLLIDMTSPGISVEPIVTLDGVHHTNQVFFDNVLVPVENVVGEEGDGWKIAKYLLSRERGFIADTGNKLRMMEQIRASVVRYAPASLSRRTLLQARLLELEASLTALVALEHDYIEAWMSGYDDGVGASVLKVRGTELLQQMTEFWRDVLGVYGACYDPALRKKGGAGLAASEPWVQAASINYAYLYGRCWSIFGGTNEVQRNIIAATLLRG